ncbi:MAG: ferritin family protein [Lachnospiraceae bacterium]
MAINLKESETKENLMKAFAGESQARNRYTFAAEEAKKQNLYSIGQIFLYTGEQERAHGARYYQLLTTLSGQTIDICASYPVDDQMDILTILKQSRHNEFHEYEEIYQQFGDIAKEEGFLEVASAFYQIAEIEKCHGNRFAIIAQMLENGTYFARPKEHKWMCTNCGHIHEGRQVPGVCPACHHNKGFFIPIELAPYQNH